MKKIINLLLISFIAAGLTACWSEDIPEAGAARHQVTDLTATPGDEEVLLSWSLPEGWNPTDFIVYYTDADSETVTLRTGGEMNCTVGGLVNDTQYTFYVQAVYGKLVSNYVAAVGRPATTRFPVTDLTVDAGDSFVSLAWTKPATTVLSYTLSYYNEDTPDNVEQQTLDKDATSVTLDKLINDKNYYFSLTANYEKGASEPATAKAMPTLAIPYILDRDKAAKNQPITFSFNTEDYPTATDVKWTFPGDVVKEGTVVKYGLGTVGTQTVKLNATIDGNARSWTLEVEIREYVIYSTDWAQDGSNYNGFKGTCPVFSPDGKTVYIITFNKVSALYAFDVVTGNEKWRYLPTSKSGSYNMLTVNPVTGDIYYGTTSAGQCRHGRRRRVGIPRRLFRRHADARTRKGGHAADCQGTCRGVHPARRDEGVAQRRKPVEVQRGILGQDPRRGPDGRSVLRSPERHAAAVPRQHERFAGRGAGHLVRRHELRVRIERGDSAQNRLGEDLRGASPKPRDAASRRAVLARPAFETRLRRKGRRAELQPVVLVASDLRQHAAERHYHQPRTEVQYRNLPLFEHLA